MRILAGSRIIEAVERFGGQTLRCSYRSWTPPTTAGMGHTAGEIADFAGHRRAAFAMATLPFPVQSESLVMPSDDDLWFDDDQ
jgi:ABC-type Fe3+-hydroxamate transport system substrate-binding protein